MKKFLILLLPILLTACGGPDTQQPDKENVGNSLPDQTAEDIQKAEKERSAIENEASEKQDPQTCKGIKDDMQRGSCEYNILANKAVREQNPALCDQITVDEFATMCRELNSSTEE